MNNLFDIIIVGGGSAGVFTAIQIAQFSSKRVLLLEKSHQVLTKFMISGAGRCNLTHQGGWEEFSLHYGTHSRFFKSSFYQFDNTALINFFNTMGFDFYETQEGKYFPTCESAKALAFSLMEKATTLAVVCQLNTQVTAIIHTHSSCANNPNTTVNHNAPSCPNTPSTTVNHNAPFKVTTQAGEFHAHHLVITTGGCSYPKTGSDGSLFPILGKLGIPIVTPRQALTSITITPFPLAPLSGLSFTDATLTLFKNGKQLYRRKGELLITPQGFSGPLILNNSRDINPQERLKIGFINKTPQELVDYLNQKRNTDGKKQLSSVLQQTGIPLALAKWICSSVTNKEEGVKLADTSNKILQQVAQLACGGEYTVTAMGGWDKAMATAGGVDLKSVNPSTMESKIIEKLYFAGEVLDIDGDTGGYNLQAAFSTGFSVAKTICGKE